MLRCEPAWRATELMLSRELLDNRRFNLRVLHCSQTTGQKPTAFDERRRIKCRRPNWRNMAMVSISRSMLLAASLLAFPLAGAMAQHDPSREEGKICSASASNQTGSPQSTAPGYQTTNDVNGKPSSGNAATAGQSGKKPPP